MDIGVEFERRGSLVPEGTFTIDGHRLPPVRRFRIRDKPYAEGGGKEVTLVFEPDTLNGNTYPRSA